MKTATGEYIIIQKLKVAWDTAAKASTLLYAAAQATLQGNTTRAAAAMKLFNGIVKANPVGLAVAAITALAGAFYLLSKRTEEARSKQELLGKIQQEAKSKTSAEITQIKALYDAAKNQANSIDARRKLIAEMNRISPEYLSNLNLETIGTKKAKDAINEYCKSLEAMAELESAKNMLTDIDKQIIELKNKTRDNISEDIKWLKILPKHVQTVVMPFAVKWIEQKTDNGEDDLSKLKKEREEYVQIIRKKTEEIFTEKKEEPKPNNVPSVPEETTGETPSEKERKKKLKEDQKKEETQYNNELKEIKEKYLNDLTITEEDYNEMIENAEIAHLERMLEIAGLEPDERAKIQEKILDEKVKWRDKLQKLDDKANKKELKDEQKQNKAVAKEETKEQKEAYERTKRKYNLEIQQATENHYKNRTSDKQFKEELLNIQNSFDKEVLSDLQISDEKKLEIQAKTNENRLKQTEEEYNQYKEKLSNTFNTLSDVAQEFGSEFGDFLSDESKTLGDFAKDVVKIMLSTLEKIMVGAIAERTIKNIASLGVVGVAKAAAEIALISAAFEGAKALIGNFYTGGFTDDGKWDEPKGVVHSNEFVANRFAVRNPQVLPVLKLIDSAQKSNTVGSLTARDISNVLGVTQVATAMPSQVQVPGSYDNSEISSVLSRTAKTIEKLNERLNEPFTTINTVSGRGGIKEATDKYNRLISNKSRGGKAS
jgi:chemotaxis protein histidine kinase CheA